MHVGTYVVLADLCYAMHACMAMVRTYVQRHANQWISLPYLWLVVVL